MIKKTLNLIIREATTYHLWKYVERTTTTSHQRERSVAKAYANVSQERLSIC